MRSFFASIAVGLSLISAPALAIPEWMIPSPFTVALQIGKWIALDNSQDQVYYVQVQSTGPTESEARKEAFRLAVDQAVGSLLVSETKIHNDTHSHETVNYSSGYIHDFEYVNIHRQPGKVVLQVDVYVKKSKIAERISLKESVTGKLQGGRIAESFRSLQEQDYNSDRVLARVLDDFPERAVDINATQIDYVYIDRKPTLEVEFTVNWKPKYIVSLDKTLANIGKQKQNPYTGVSIVGNTKCGTLWCNDTHYTTDRNHADLIYEGIAGKRPNVLVTILDLHSQPVYSTCWWWPNMQGQANGNNQLFSNYTTIHKQAILNNKLQLDLSNYNVTHMEEITLKVVRQSDCPES